jgi:hypothetical protein
MKKQQKKWSKKEIISIFNLRNKKITYKTIAFIFKVSINSIYKTIQRYKAFSNIKNSHSFFTSIQWFNKKFPNSQIRRNTLDFNFVINKEVYSKTSILLIINKHLLANNMKIINDNKFIKYKTF